MSLCMCASVSRVKHLPTSWSSFSSFTSFSSACLGMFVSLVRLAFTYCLDYSPSLLTTFVPHQIHSHQQLFVYIAKNFIICRTCDIEDCLMITLIETSSKGKRNFKLFASFKYAYLYHSTLSFWYLHFLTHSYIYQRVCSKSPII